MLGSICVELIDALFHKVHRPMTIIETGTLRDPEPEPGLEKEERSTLAIAQWIESTGLPHKFCSIDYSLQNINTSQQVLEAHGLRSRVAYFCDDSRIALSTKLLEKVDFALLDSDTDPDVILGEYNSIREAMKDPGIIVIDDCFKQNIGVDKGKLVIPLAKKDHEVFGLRKQAMGIAYGRIAAEILRSAFMSEQIK